MNDLISARVLLNEGGYTCVLCKGEKTYTSSLRGVKPLVSWYERGTDLKGFCAADKVVGKATAFLYILHGVVSVYAKVISRPALELLEQNGIKAEYAMLSENIINRQGDGICPFESAVINISDTKTAYKKILEKMIQMNISLE